MKAITSKHARRRLSKRLGLKVKAHNRHLEIVLKNGTYIKSSKEPNIFYVIYDSRRYIFNLLDHVRALLITVFPREKNIYKNLI
jgi:hypothetical protein